MRALSVVVSCYTAQLSAPELLVYPQGELDALLGQVESQQGILDSLSAEGEGAGGDGDDEHLRLSLVALDLERARWLVRHLLRTRLALIERHPTHNTHAMSSAEKAYAHQ